MTTTATPTLHQPAVLKPAQGKQVRKEDATWLPEAGDTVIFTSYWARRLAEGDVEVVEPARTIKETK